MSITTREVGDVTIIDISGRLSMYENAGNLRDLIIELAEKGNKKVVLNLADTTYVDSCGIGEMISGFTKLANQGARLKLLALTKRVKDLLQITKLYTVFDVYEDEASAVQSFV
ncbi:MAG: STAS domain-containing protein [Minisyncoccia bacterium]